VVISKKLTLFNFRKSLNQSVEVEATPHQLEFVGDVLAMRYADRRVRFLRLAIAEGAKPELQITPYGPTNIQCELMFAHTAGSKFVLLSKEQLWLILVGLNDITSKEYQIVGCRLAANSQLSIKR
jgi:hypothetical protein